MATVNKEESDQRLEQLDRQRQMEEKRRQQMIRLGQVEARQQASNLKVCINRWHQDLKVDIFEKTLYL